MKSDLIKTLYGQMAGAVFPRDIEGTCQVELTDQDGSCSAYIGYYGHSCVIRTNGKRILMPLFG